MNPRSRKRPACGIPVRGVLMKQKEPTPATAPGSRTPSVGEELLISPGNEISGISLISANL